MSKLIIEMEIDGVPDCCGLCDPLFMVSCAAKHDQTVDKMMLRVGRPSWCPIKGELPDEHGDLIDRDAFIHKYLAFYTEQERKKNLVFAAVEVKQQFADMICDERAVIAAERKDDEQIH